MQAHSLRLASGIRIRARARIGRVATTRSRGDAFTTGVAFKETHAFLKLTDLLRFNVLVHALALEAAGATALASAVALWASGRRLSDGLDDKVIELCQNSAWKRINFKLNFLSTL